LSHGLGFDQSFNLWDEFYGPQMTGDEKYLAPKLNIVPDSQNQPVVASWVPMSIFDKFTVEVATDQPLAKTGRVIQSFRFARNTPLEKCISDFEASGAPYEAAKRLYGVVISGMNTVEFRSIDSSSLSLSTKPGRFFQGTSLAHLDYDRYWTTAEFLMIPAVQNLTGRSLDQIIALNQGEGVYGPKTLAMFHTLGWSLPGKDGTGKVRLKPVDEKDSGSIGLAIPALVLVLLCLFI
jgi:hypothetical protein